MNWLETILPSQGVYCVARLLSSGGFQHFWHDDLITAQQRLTALDTQGHQMFVAQASFLSSDSRKQVNAAYLKTFFLDIDCGKGKPHADQQEGADALHDFCDKTLLPPPTIINSGNGLYAYWILDKEIPARIWSAAANLLKGLCIHHGFKIDPSRAADSASVLRPLGTHNRKQTEAKEVRFWNGTKVSPLHPLQFISLLKGASDKVQITPPTPKKVDLNSDIVAGLEGPPSSAHLVASKCAQIDFIRSTKGDVSEPLWYASVGLLRYCQEGSDLIHEWSSGHPDYTPEETERKIAQHENANIGPTTCHHFATVNPDLCVGCRHSNKITTPLQLGRPEPKRLEAEYPELPTGFTVSESGVYAIGEETLRIYPYPLWITGINRDHFGESVTIRHRLPFSGWHDTVIQSSRVHEPKSFFMALLDEHIHVIGKENRGQFMRYIENFMAKLREKQEIARLSGQMGWHGDCPDMTFALGAELFKADGSAQAVGYSATAPEFVKHMRAKGDIQPWVGGTVVLNRISEGLAFEFLATAFGAPLVRFTGYPGAMISVVGSSGTGKTLMGRYGLSAYGDPERLILIRDDTRNALVARLGVYGSLPAYLDEVSNIDDRDLSELAYRVTQGREKIRLNKNAQERTNVNQWTTLAVASSNHPLLDKLSALKGDPGAEFNRIFEYELEDGEGIDRETGTKLNTIFTDNYGGVGREYIKYLTSTQHLHRDNLTRIAASIDKQADTQGDERYWSMIAAVVIYGGMLAQKQGLSRVDVSRLIPWTVQKIREARKFKADSTEDGVVFLGTFLDRNSSGILVVDSYAPDGGWKQTYKDPRGRLVARIETSRKRMWISRDALKEEMQRRHLSIRKVAAALKERGVIVNSDTRISLGRGTLHGGIVQPCWEIDLTKPELGHVAMQIVSKLEEGKVENE